LRRALRLFRHERTVHGAKAALRGREMFLGGASDLGCTFQARAVLLWN